MYAGSTGGNDRLISAAHTTDDMWGDAATMVQGAIGGHDTFVFAPSNGNDVIHDFQQGVDLIELDGFSNPAQVAPHLSHPGDHLSTQATNQLLLSFADLNIHTIDTNHDGIADSSVIRFDAHDSVTVLGVTHLQASDFSIVA